MLAIDKKKEKMANYNCSDSTNNAYGAGDFGACTTQSVGAPNTGVFQELITGGSFTLIAPLVVSIVAVIIASQVVVRRKKRKT